MGKYSHVLFVALCLVSRAAAAAPKSPAKDTLDKINEITELTKKEFLETVLPSRFAWIISFSEVNQKF
jgi:hypothetical protein